MDNDNVVVNKPDKPTDKDDSIDRTRPRPMPTSDYEKLRQTCLDNGRLYEDPEFSADDTSIYFNKMPPYKLQWKRPHEIASNYGLQPKFFVDGGSRFDLRQGELGDCWVLAAAASVCDFNRAIFEWLVPHDQDFIKDRSYAGIFRFRFWRYGEWKEVCVDDRLPTYDNRLVFVHSSHANEFWGALLEKAYAKDIQSVIPVDHVLLEISFLEVLHQTLVHGTYEAIKGGSNADSLTDFTGGLVESYSMHDVPHDLPRLLAKAFTRKSVIAASIYGDYENDQEVSRNGLVMGHAYSVTGFATVKDIDGKQHMLIRIRNPWGTRTEWNGRWSDKSGEWTDLPEDVRNSLRLQVKADGEFWMSLSDFVRNFDSLEICNLTPDSLRDAPKPWTISVQHNSWKVGVNAGGRPSYKGSFYKNTQYHLTLDDHAKDEDNLASMVVELMQKDRRSNRHLGYDNLAIGFLVYRVPPGTALPLSDDELDVDGDLLVGTSEEYVNARSVVRRFALTPGDYVIVASTWEPNEEAEYMLRIFTEAAHHVT